MIAHLAALLGQLPWPVLRAVVGAMVLLEGVALVAQGVQD